MSSPCGLPTIKHESHGCNSCGSPVRYRSHGLVDDLESVYGRSKALESTSVEADSGNTETSPNTDSSTTNVSIVLNGALFGGDKYDGEWSHGKPNGKGSMIYDDGRRYEGEWKDGKRHGRGTFKSNGNEYEGDWVEDKHHGTGRYRWADGDWHEGSFFEGKIHGLGVRYVPSQGCREEGEWADDRREGRHVFYWDDGGKAEAEWKNGVRSSGTYTGLDGRVCDLKSFSEKAWFDRSTPSNQTGEFRWPTSTFGIEYYKGKIERGRMHGKGVLKMQDGSCFEGEFQDDVPFKGSWTQGPSSQLTLDDVRRELFHRRFVRPASPPLPASRT